MHMFLETIKWIGTILLIIGIYFSSRNVYPLGPSVQLIGGLFWLWAAFIMRDKPLVVTNLVMSIVGLTGLWTFYEQFLVK